MTCRWAALCRLIGDRSDVTEATGYMSLWLTLAVNSIALGGLLFLLSSGFSLIFGLMRIPNLMHGSFFMLGAYFGVTLLARGVNFWVAALVSAAAMALIGGLIERLLLRRLAGDPAAAGAADAGRRLHRRRPLPDAVDRRSLAAGDARASARRRAGGGTLLSALPAGDRRRRRRRRHRALAAGRLDAARRQDPRRRR